MEACFYANISKQSYYDLIKYKPELIDRFEALRNKPFSFRLKKALFGQKLISARGFIAFQSLTCAATFFLDLLIIAIRTGAVIPFEILISLLEFILHLPIFVYWTKSKKYYRIHHSERQLLPDRRANAECSLPEVFSSFRCHRSKRQFGRCPLG